MKKRGTMSRFALAWAACLAICAAVEAALHVLPAGWLLTYDQQSAALTQNADFVNIRRAVVGTPAPQICIVGSSRARAIVSAPVIRRFLREHGCGDLDVRVYAGPNLNGAACLALVGLMRDYGHVPELLIYAVEPRQLADCQGVSAALLCDLPRGFRNGSPVQVKSYKPVRLLVATWADLRVRSFWLRELVRLQPPLAAQTLGGFSNDQTRHMTEKEEDSLVIHPIDLGTLQIELFSTDCEKRRSPSHWQLRYTEMALDLMKQTVNAAVVELPLPEVVHRAYRPGYYEEVVSFYAEACRTRGIPFIRAADVGFAPEEKYFANATHANWSGARLYSTALAEKVIAPALREQQAKTALVGKK